MPSPARILSLGVAPSARALSIAARPAALSAARSPAPLARAGPSRLVGRRWNSSAAAEDEGRFLAPPEEGSKGQVLGQIEPRLSMTFTCTADDCNHRSTHEFARRSYERGIVIVQCPSCKNRHLIADHLGWFKESTEDGSLKTVEDLVRAKGEAVRRGRVGMDGDIEYFE
ncbi:hypothetical protein Q5752_002061 [Cryptotrichosporon argae]